MLHEQSPTSPIECPLVASFERFSVSISRTPPPCDDHDCELTSCSAERRKAHQSVSSIVDYRCDACGGQPVIESRRTEERTYNYCAACCGERQEAFDHYLRTGERDEEHFDADMQERIDEYRAIFQPQAHQESPVSPVSSASLEEQLGFISGAPQGGERIVGAKPDVGCSRLVRSGQRAHALLAALESSLDGPLSDASIVPPKPPPRRKRSATTTSTVEPDFIPLETRSAKAQQTLACDYKQGLECYGIYLCVMPSFSALGDGKDVNAREVVSRLSALAARWAFCTGEAPAVRNARPPPPAIYNYARRLGEGLLSHPLLVRDRTAHSDAGLCEHASVYYWDSPDGLVRTYHAEVLLPPIAASRDCSWDRAKSNRARVKIESEQERISCTTYMLTSDRVRVPLANTKERAEAQVRLVGELKRLLLSCTYCNYVGRGYACEKCGTRVTLGAMASLGVQECLSEWRKARDSSNCNKCKKH